MKKLLILNGVILYTLLNIISVKAETREKKISRTFDVDKNTYVEISNKFGKIHIETWDKNQLDFEASITANNRNENAAQRLLDEITIDMSHSSSQLEIKTKMGKLNNSKNESFSIDFSIKMPRSNPLEVSNAFGDLYLADYEGNTEIDVSYGNLKIEKLRGNTEINLSFGTGESYVDYLKNGEVNVKYSNLFINEAENFELDDQFSKVRFTKVSTVAVDSKYGDLRFDQLDMIEGDIEFSGLEIGRLTNSIILDISYGKNVSFKSIDSNFQKIELDCEFTSFDLNFDKNISASLEANFEFGDLNYDNGLVDMSYIEKNFNSKEYKGVIGDGLSSVINIDSRYGSVSLKL